MSRDLRGADVSLLGYSSAFVGDSKAASQAPDSSNTGAYTVQNGVVGGSEDTIVLSLFIDWGVAFDDMLLMFGNAQACSREGDEEGRFIEKSGIVAAVESAGAGKGRNYRRFVMTIAGLRFEFAAKQKTEDESPNGMVTIGSLVCSQRTPIEIMKLVRFCISTFGGVLLHNKLNRIDGCVDLPGVKVRHFHRAYFDGRCISRARKGSDYFEGREIQSFYLGRSGCKLRIYDKVAEQLSNGDPEKLAFLLKNRWAGKVPECSARVEIQVPRKILKTFVRENGERIESFEDYLECRDAFWNYLVTEWVRFTTDEVDRNHTERAETCPIWQRVIDSFMHWARGGKQDVERVHAGKTPSMALADQAVGCLIKLAAGTATSIEGFLASAGELVSQSIARMGDEKFDGKMESARLFYESTSTPDSVEDYSPWRISGISWREWQRASQREHERLGVDRTAKLLF